MGLPTPAPDALPLLLGPVPGPESRRQLAALKACESPGVTCVGPEFPVVWRSARGAAVIDVDGNRYVDGTSAFGVAFVGHAHPRVVAAIQRQAETLLHGMGDVHPPQVRIALLAALQAMAPGDLGHGVLCGGGSEAVEVALKTAWLHTGRAGVVSFAGAYHGLGGAALEATARPFFRAPFAPLMRDHTRFLPYPRAPALWGPVRGPSVAEVLGRLEDLLGEDAGEASIGAVIVEPLQGRGGTVVPADGFLTGLRALCDRHGALLIVDEIFTGLGRAGDLFACDHAGVLPDLLCLGKALGGGMPLSVCLGRPHVMASWGESQGEALHTSTFLGHPLACAAALETLRVLADEDLVATARARGRQLSEALIARLGHRPDVVDVRGRGLMWGVELAAAGGRPAGERVFGVVVHALRHGALLLPCGDSGEVVQLTPPACIAPAQLDALVDALVAAVEAV